MEDGLVGDGPVWEEVEGVVGVVVVMSTVQRIPKCWVFETVELGGGS